MTIFYNDINKELIHKYSYLSEFRSKRNEIERNKMRGNRNSRLESSGHNEEMGTFRINLEPDEQWFKKMFFRNKIKDLRE